MNIIQAFIWNWRTYDFDVKGKITSKDLARVKVPMQNIGAEQLVVVKKFL
jgi:threonyl-tRNA synthetase